MYTPDKVEGYVFNSTSDCNWKKCWAYAPGSSSDPYLILLEDDTLWVVPKEMEKGTWGGSEYTPRPPTHLFIGPFDTFEEGIATLALLGESVAPLTH